jgi:hypothetical protein
MGVGLDLLFDKAAHHFTIGLVFGGVEWVSHSFRSWMLLFVTAYDVPKPHV